MTTFEYDNLPDSLESVDPLPSDLNNLVREILNSSPLYVRVEEVKVAYLYDRKGYLAIDDFQRPRNPAYSSTGDDVMIQLSVRLGSANQNSLIANLKDILEEREVTARRNVLENEIELIKAGQLASAEALAKRVIELSALKKGL